jgi:hypothetical protein
MPYVNSYLSLHHELEGPLMNFGASVIYLGDYIGCRMIYLEACYYIYKTIGLRNTLIASILVVCFGFGLVSVWPDPYAVVLFDNLIIGVGCGVINVSSIWPLHSIFGSSNATVTGLAMLGFSIGPSLYGLILTEIVNPDNLTANGIKSTDEIYPDSVSKRVPLGFLVLSAIFFTVGMISLLIIKIKPNSDSESSQDEAYPTLSYKQIFQSSGFWRLFWFFFLSYFSMIFFISDYRTFMLKYIKDDHLISYTNTISIITDNIGSVVWMIFLDYTSFNTSMIVINSILMILLATLPIIWNIPIAFIVWICALWFCFGGLYAASVYETYNAFPGDTGKKVWPLLTIPWNLSVFCTVGITAIGDWYGYSYAIYILIAMTIASIAIILFWKHSIIIQKESLSSELISDEISINKPDDLISN